MELKLAVQHERAALWLGLIVRLALLVAVPVTYTQWFLPFLLHAAQAGGIDPWSGFLAAGGTVRAFPYGPLYLLMFAPLTALGGLLSLRAAALGMGLTVLALDILLLLVLRQLVDVHQRAIAVYAYWLSPVVIYVCYWHGQLDVLPVLILAAALMLLRERRFAGAGLTMGLATAAKMSMGIAIPFVWIYVTAARRLRGRALRLIMATCLGLATLAPFLLSGGFREMVLETPEREKIFALTIGYGDLLVYVMPIVFIALVLTAWRIRRFNFDILFSLIGVGFFILFLLTPASPGWSLWLTPFLVVYLARAGRGGWLLAVAFSLLFVLFHLLTSSGATLPFTLSSVAPPPRALNLLLSLYLASGGVIAFQMLHQGLLRDRFFRTTRRPLALGIAGDSGAGKDTLVAALRDLFGATATAVLSGDDYHSWDRHKPMWRALTHLNPDANDLRRFNEDVLALKSGYAIEVPHYDHAIGRMTKPQRIEPTDVIIASGLHALYTAELNEALDLRVFLAMDEDLRLFLKLRRDVRVRGHSPEAVVASLRKREADSARYIRPQAAASHLVLALVPLDRRELSDPLGGGRSVRMALRVETSTGTNLDSLSRILVSLIGLDVVPAPARAGRIAIEITGAPSTADIGAGARALVPAMGDYLAIAPRWNEGMMGLMQLAVLDQLGQRLGLQRGV